MTVSRLFLLVLLSCCLSVHASGSRINIVNNGYRDIVVAISPDVPPDEADDLLDNIQLLITEASYDLYEATRHRSYIESVRILIPQTWVNVTVTNASTWENFQDADIHIDLPNWKRGDRPYTVQFGGCGDPGEYIHLTPNYVMNFDSESSIFKFGPAGKVFVREWARLRYGVFEEHGYTGVDASFPMFYRSASTQQTDDLVPNVCSNEPVNDFTFDYGCYVDPETGLYDPNCTYSFTDQFKPGSSIMSDYRMLSSAVDFCDDDASSTYKHNREAPNKQNSICDKQSVWSVISRHVDFAEDNNLPANITDFTPTFNIVQVVNGARYVLVTDVSGSMILYDRITRLNQAARRWINYDIADGTSLGIVKFGVAALQSDMTVVSSATRQQLMDVVPDSVDGGTCIGCGLLMAIQTLSPGGKGGVIVLVTDGEETIKPYIRDVYPQLIDLEAQVVSIAFGQAAEEEIEVLATKTKGKSYFINDVGNVDGLNTAFNGSLTYQPAVPSEELTILLNETKYQNPGNEFKNSVLVDYTVGRELTFRVDYSNTSYLQTFSVMSPSGLPFDNLIVGNDTKAPTAFIKIPDVAEDGYWNYTLTVANSQSDSANVIVTTKSKSSSGPITVECSVPSGLAINASVTAVTLVAVVKQRNNMVIGAEVRAFVERPDTALQVIDLVDTGVGADGYKNDGIYSRYYIDPSNSGRYTLVCDVKSTNSTYIENGESDQQLRTTTGNFARHKSGGSFRVELPLKETFPPSRVTDLKVVAMQVDQMSVTIQWTAPGQELDIGTATEYEIKYSDVFDNVLESNFNSNSSVLFGQQDVLDGSLQPLQSGSKQRVTLALPRTSDDVTYYIALRALNENKAASNTSNIVSVQIVPVKPPQTQPPTTTKTTTPTSTQSTTPTTTRSTTPTTTQSTTPTTTSTSTTKAPETSTSVNTGCNSVLTSSSGLLTSPDYPGPYPDDYDCQWIIRVASASKIRLTFSHFDIESFDFVEVYDGASVSGRLLLKHSGSTVPGDVVSSSNEMLVRFITDGTGNYFRGWRATYTSS